MATAIVGGAVRDGAVSPDRVVVADPNASKLDVFRGWGVRTAGSGAEAMSALASLDGGPQGMVMLAVKPQMLPEVSSELRPLLGADRVLVSILAGITSTILQGALGSSIRVARVMPNTPAFVREGVTTMSFGASMSAAQRDAVRALFDAVGETLEIEESSMDSNTAVAGSGPAYLFVLAEAMVRAGTEMGLDPAATDLMVRQTLRGAATLLRDSEQDAGTLRAAVTSKGGMTAAALESMEASGVSDAIVRAIIAARDRGAELAAMSDGEG